MFSFLTEPNYPSSAIGIEKERITAVSLQKEGRGRFGVKQAASVDVPRGAVEPSFLEKNIANSGELRVLLQDAVEMAGLANQKNWSISLPAGTARSAILTIDSVPGSKKELEEMLAWKAEQSFGAPAADLRIAQYKLNSESDGKARYFAAAVALRVLDEYETIFESVGWKAGLIVPRVVGESAWLSSAVPEADSILLSLQSDGFVALLLRGGKPTVVRSVTCAETEREDEVYRLLMFYNDRYSSTDDGSFLDKILVIGSGLVPDRVRSIAADALGRTPNVLDPEDVALSVPSPGLNFDDLAAPAGLASLAWN